MFPSVPTAPGAYRLTFTDASGTCIGVYVGRGGSLRQRLQHYKTPGTGHRDTKTRVNGLLLSASSGGTVKAEIATSARADLGLGEAMPLDLSVEAARGLAENAALSVAYAAGLPVLNGGYGGQDASS